MKRISRRQFTGALAATGAVPSVVSAQQEPASPPPWRGTAPETPPFGEALTFTRKEIPLRVQPFPMAQVRLISGPFKDAQEWNRGYLHRLDANRLLHNFRANAGLPSPAQPLGGWERAADGTRESELRGHFTGHFLSACGLMYSSTGDQELKSKADQMVAELAKCQQKLGGGYLSAFPLELFDRLDARKPVWAPFYTVHKIMAGMLDMYQHCDNKQALDVLKGMADWADRWSASKSEPHMQDILNTEYGGMNEVLYNLAAVTGEDRYATAGDRFTKKKFFNPLALRRDELRGLHVNTHIPQVIGAARRHELTGDMRFHDVADYFWYEVTTARAYVTGGTSNDEAWLVEPRRLASELRRATDTTECCCAYNMLKLTRHLYGWTADPRYFDYYERTLFNHRLGTIEPGAGHTMYYLPLRTGSWKTFCTENDSFWCCTGTGAEEYAKLNDSIYFHDAGGLHVNLFIASELRWPEKGLRLRQETSFPEGQSTSLILSADQPVEMPLRIRVPWWLTSGGAVKINGQRLEAFPGPGSYLTLARTWKSGDRVEIDLPMGLHAESMPDDPRMQAVLYGPLVLAGDLGSEGLTKEMITGPMGPDLRNRRLETPALSISSIQPAARGALVFQEGRTTLLPLNRIFGKRYSTYWNVS